MSTIHIPVSVLNLGPVRKDEGMKESIDALVDLAKTTEKMGYERYWIAEHHNTSRLISSATSILIKHVLEHTEKIKVGSGGVMLPNHSPLVVAEQFGTMAHLYPNRVELGLGRAPGTDMLTAQALRRTQSDEAVFSFPEDINQLLTYFGGADVQGPVKANIAIDTNVPLYVLGSSTNSAYLAAELGLPYVFASHFAPRYMEEAIAIYRERFKPSAYLDAPYMMVCLNVVAAESDEEAALEMTTMQQFFLNIVRGTQYPLSPPVEKIKWLPQEEAAISSMTRATFVGGKDTVHKQLSSFQDSYAVDEIMAVTYMYDREKQARSYEIFKDIVTK